MRYTDSPSSAARILFEKTVSELKFRLGTGQLAPGVNSEFIHRPEGGKMFGICVSRDASGGLVSHRAFSGQLGPLWNVDGFVGPVFLPQRLIIQESGEQSVDELTEQLEKTVEKQERERLLHERRTISRRTMLDVYRQYEFSNAFGETSNLLEMFAPGVPPWGAGDCAAPKLLFHAFENELVPLVLGEFWWGPASRSGAKKQGEFYPPCEARCGPILKFLLKGITPEWLGMSA